MRRIETVGELIEALQELPEEMKIMAQHQPTWPLREFIGGIWVDDGIEDDEEAHTCESCGRVTLGELHEEADGWFRQCFHCGELQACEPPLPKEEHIAYIVLNGHPYNGTPYGNKRAWEEVSW